MPSEVLKNFKVLVVDNDLLIRKLVLSVLQHFGFVSVTLAKDGRKAQELLLENNYDFMITDWRMEDIDGIDVVHFVRRSQTASKKHMPIIMLTGNTEVDHVSAARDAGVTAYLIKPFSAKELARRIRLIIEEPRPFIISKKFTGPDRRHSSQTPPNGIERRKAEELQ